MGSKVLRNVTKILKATSGRLFGRVTSGTGRAEELTPADVRTLISVYSTSEVDAIIGGIDGLTSADIDTLAEINAILSDADLASVSYVDGLAGNYATAAQGSLADSAVQPSDLATVATTGSYNDLIDTPAGSSGDVVGPASAVDNAAARFDTTTGKLIQSSNWIIADNITASPNNTVNHACLEATGGTTNVSVSIKPKGSGSFSLNVPDGTATGGNVRGANAVDLQTVRTTATQVASGAAATIGGGLRNSATGSSACIPGTNDNVASGFNSFAVGGFSTASGNYAIALGSGVASGQESLSCCFQSLASNTGSIALGQACTASGTNAFATNSSNLASGPSSFATGFQSVASLHGQQSVSSGRFAANGDAQSTRFVLRNKTTDDTPTTLFLNGSSLRVTIPAGKVLSFTARITGIKSDGTAVAEYLRRGVIKRIVNTTSLVGAVETIGTDIEDNALTDVAITADDTNEALQINVTGITGETWRWVAVVEGLEIAYGT
jgi:hypothetical protein